MLQYVFNNWYNVYNFYGDLVDLDVVLLEDVDVFFKMYYVLNNVVLVLVGDFDLVEVKMLVEKYFGNILLVEIVLQFDLIELCQEKEQVFNKFDKLVLKFVFVFVYKMLLWGMFEYYVMGIID